MKLNKIEDKHRKTDVSKSQQPKKEEVEESSDEGRDSNDDIISPRSTPSPSNEAPISESPKEEVVPFKAFLAKSRTSANSSERSSISSDRWVNEGLKTFEIFISIESDFYFWVTIIGSWIQILIKIKIKLKIKSLQQKCCTK